MEWWGRLEGPVVLILFSVTSSKGENTVILPPVTYWLWFVLTTECTGMPKVGTLWKIRLGELISFFIRIHQIGIKERKNKCSKYVYL